MRKYGIDNKQREGKTAPSCVIIIYCTMSGIEHVLSEKADFVLRFKSKAFKLYDENGELLELLPHFRHLKALEGTEAWFFGKLLLAAICEALLKRAFFPLELESIIVDFVGTQFVDTIVFNS